MTIEAAGRIHFHALLLQLPATRRVQWERRSGVRSLWLRIKRPKPYQNSARNPKYSPVQISNEITTLTAIPVGARSESADSANSSGFGALPKFCATQI